MNHRLILAKKYLIVFIILISIVIINANFAYSATVSELLEQTGGAALYDTTEEATDVPILVGRIIRTFLSLLGVFFIGLTIYGGFLWMNARGDAEQVNKAKGVIKDALIGLIIAISAYAITYFVLSSIVKYYATQKASGF